MDSVESQYQMSRLVISSFVDITERLKGRRFTSNNESAIFTGTVMKLWQHGVTALKLCDEPFNDQFPEHRDYASISVLARAVIESAGILKYLFYSDTTDEERQFILDCMELRSILVQTEYAPSSPQYIEKHGDLLRRIEVLQKGLKNHSRVKDLKPRQQNALLEGRSEPFAKSSLPIKLGFGPRASRYYRYLSDYTHGGYLAALQTSQPDEAQKMAKASLLPIALSFAYLINTLYSHSRPVREFVDQDETLKHYVYNFVHWGNGEESNADTNDGDTLTPE